MRLFKLCSKFFVALGVLSVGLNAYAHREPPTCGGAGVGVQVFKFREDGTVANTITNGEKVIYRIQVQNDAQLPQPGGPVPVCNVTCASVFFRCPDATGNPGPQILVASNVDLPFGTTPFLVGSITCTVTVASGNLSAKARAEVIGVVHDLTIPGCTPNATCVTNTCDPDVGGGQQEVSVTVRTPCIAVTKQCILAENIGGNAIRVTFSGSVSNCGDEVLSGVTVVNDQPAPNTLVTNIGTLTPGTSIPFSGVYTNTSNICGPFPDTVTATGTGVGSLGVRTASASAQCTIVYTPLIRVTKTCPPTPPSPGGILTFSGTVSNAGNITLTNVTVTDDVTLTNGGTLVASFPSLAPGEVQSFTGSIRVPTNVCSITDTLTARGTNICGLAGVVHTASATCPVATHPRLTMTKNCPVTAPAPGQQLTYTGTITNIGDVAITNILLTDSIFGTNTAAPTPSVIARLEPGAGATFTGSYTVPVNVCSITDTVTATGTDVCGIAVTTNVSATCPITVTPRLTLTKACPVTAPAPGQLLTYTGTITNIGNVAVTNISLTDSIFGTNTSAPTPSLIARLEPGQGATFTGSYTVPTNVCSITDTVVASGTDVCGNAVTTNVSRTCPITVTPRLALTKACPASAPQPGQLLTYTGTLTNIGNVAVTNISLTDSIFGTNTAAPTPALVARLEPGQGITFTGSYVAPVNVCSVTDTITATGTDVCGNNVTTNVSATCPIGSTPRLTLTKLCPVTAPAPGTLLTYTGTVTNIGNIAVTNIVLTDSIFGTNTAAPTPSVIARLEPGQGATFTGSYLVPTNVCSITDTVTATGRDVCNNLVTTNTSATCPIITTPRLTMTKACPATAPAPGQTLTYTGTITNIGNVAVTNIALSNAIFGTNTTAPTPSVIARLEPGQGATFTGSYLVPLSTCSGTVCAILDTVTATGTDVCGIAVTTNVSRTCPVATAPSITVTKLCTPETVQAGATVTFSGVVANNGNVALTNVSLFDTFLNRILLTNVCLNPGASLPFTTNYVTTEADCARGRQTNTVIASGIDFCNPLGIVRATNSCTFIVDCPKICIIKEVACFLGTNAPAPLAIEPLEPGELCGPFGELATGVQGDTQNPAFCFRITVTNCGGVNLTNVSVIDDKYGDLTTNFFASPSTVFAPNGTITFTFKVEIDGASLPNHISVVTNTVITRGQSANTGQQVTAQDTAVAQVIPAGIVCEQLYSVDNGPLTNCLHLDVTETHSVVTYVVIRNVGLADLLNVTITNDIPNPCRINAGPFVLPAGATQTIPLCTNASYTCSNVISTITVIASQYAMTNVSSLCAHDIDGKVIVVRSECPGCIECERPNACRVTGGGRQDDPLVYPANVRYVTHGGQVGAPVGEHICEVTEDFFLGNPCIHGRWTHVRHQQGGLRGNFHARYYDTLECACLDITVTPTTVTIPGVNGAPNQTYVNLVYGPGTTVNGRCNPGNKVTGPEPRKSPSNKIVFTGVGDWADPNGRREARATLFRVDIEDRSEPGGSHPKGGTDPADRYRIRIWVLSDAELAQLNGGSGDRYLLRFRNAISACNGINVQDGATVPNGSPAFGVRAPDIDDGGELERGNHQIHPSIKDCDPFNPTGPGLPGRD